MDAKRVTPNQFKEVAFPPGRSRYLVHVGELASGSVLEIPVEVLVGKRTGPVAIVTAGVHGEEPASMVAVSDNAKHLSPDDLKGTLISVPCVNPPAWAFRTRHYPLDAPTIVDVGSLREGDAAGVMGARVFAAMADAISARVQYSLDLHATHLDSMNYPRAMVTVTGQETPEVQAQRLELGKALGYEIVHVWRRAGHGGLTAALNQRGVPAVAAEAGEGWRALPPFPAILERGIKNFLKHIGALDGTPERPAMQVEITRRHEVAANRGGMSHLKVKPGDYVTEGQAVAEIHNLFGDVIETLRAPFNGIIVRCSLLPTVATGARVCNVYQTDRKEWATRTVPALEREIVVSGFPS